VSLPLMFLFSPDEGRGYRPGLQRIDGKAWHAVPYANIITL
jgi:hypothetical protein